MTKEEERRIFKRFIKQLEPENNHRFESWDKPDIKLVRPDKLAGVEITEILDEQRRARQMLIKKIGDRVVSKLEEKISKSFHLNLDFQPELRLSKSEINAYSDMVAKKIYRLIGPEPNQPEYTFDFDSSSTDGFTGFGILFSEVLTQSYFSESAAGFVPNFNTEDLEKILSKKERALKNYTPFDEQWLVIAEGNFLAGSVDQILISQEEINSTFDRIFIFRQATQEIKNIT